MKALLKMNAIKELMQKESIKKFIDYVGVYSDSANDDLNTLEVIVKVLPGTTTEEMDTVKDYFTSSIDNVDFYVELSRYDSRPVIYL